MPLKSDAKNAPDYNGGQVTKRNRNQIRAMSHPVRAQALRLLVERGKLSPAEIGREIGVETGKVSYHCQQLVAYDCAELVETRQVEGKGAVEHFYLATARHILETADWDALNPEMGEAVLNEIMRTIFDDYEASNAEGVIGSDSLFHLSQTPMILDREGVKEAMENSERWRLEQSEIEARSTARRHQSGEKGIHVSSSLAFFKMPRPRRRKS
ncbi:MAG TPA: helix-turn-helix domain-containing protein [Solirubrobacterales bacterium]